MRKPLSHFCERGAAVREGGAEAASGRGSLIVRSLDDRAAGLVGLADQREGAGAATTADAVRSTLFARAEDVEKTAGPVGLADERQLARAARAAEAVRTAGLARADILRVYLTRPSCIAMTKMLFQRSLADLDRLSVVADGDLLSLAALLGISLLGTEQAQARDRAETEGCQGPAEAATSGRATDIPRKVVELIAIHCRTFSLDTVVLIDLNAVVGGALVSA